MQEDIEWNWIENNCRYQMRYKPIGIGNSSISGHSWRDGNPLRGW